MEGTIASQPSLQNYHENRKADSVFGFAAKPRMQRQQKTLFMLKTTALATLVSAFFVIQSFRLPIVVAQSGGGLSGLVGALGDFTQLAQTGGSTFGSLLHFAEQADIPPPSMPTLSTGMPVLSGPGNGQGCNCNGDSNGIPGQQSSSAVAAPSGAHSCTTYTAYNVPSGPGQTGPPPAATCGQTDCACMVYKSCYKCYSDPMLGQCRSCLALSQCKDLTCQQTQGCKVCSTASASDKPAMCGMCAALN